MYKLNYFRKNLNDMTSESFKIYQKLLSGKQISQPIIFCDKYTMDPFTTVPIFHSYFMNQYFFPTDILTDFDQISYIVNFNHNNFLIAYNSDIENIDKYKDTYKFIDTNTDIITYMEQHYGK